MKMLINIGIMWFLLRPVDVYCNLKTGNELRYIKNQGQFDPSVLYMAHPGLNSLRVFKNGWILTMSDPVQKTKLMEKLHKHNLSDSVFNLSFHNTKVNYCYSNTNPSVVSQSYFPEAYHYLKGDIKKHIPSVKACSAFKIVDIYDNIDLIFSSIGNNPKTDWIVHPSGNHAKIKIHYSGVDSIHLSENGNLIIKTPFGQFSELKPYVYQNVGGNKIEIKANFKISNDTVSFEISRYNNSLDLIIDPIMVFSTYSGSLGDNFGFCATYDLKENLYTAGIINADDGEYPITPGAFQKTYGGCGQPSCDYPFEISISKYSKDGKTLLYASYLGGNRYEFPHSLNIDKNNNLLLLGSSNSTDFPTTTNAIQNVYAGGGSDFFVSRIAEDGSKVLASTYIGGSNNDGVNDDELIMFHGDYYRGEIISDKNNIIICGQTSSTDIPLSFNAFQSVNRGDQDAYIASFNYNLDTLNYASFYGGSGIDAAYGMRLSPDGKLLYISGGSGSTDLSMIGNGYSNIYSSGESDGYVAAFDIKTGKLKYSTFSGIDFQDQFFVMDIDALGRVYLFGCTYGAIMKTPTCYGEDARGQMLCRFDYTLKNQEFITTFGSVSYPSPGLSPTALMVDQCNRIYLTGWGTGMWSNFGYNDGTTMDLPITSDAYQSSTDSNDFYFMVFDKDATSLLYATFMGGNRTGDHIDGGMSRFDKNGVVYQSVCSSCPGDSDSYITDFPVSRDALFKFNDSRRCNNASFKFDFRKGNYADAIIENDPDTGCAPLDVNFKSNSNADSYFWDFGDGTTSKDSQTIHRYVKSGLYKVKLIVTRNSSCNIIDSSFKTIVVNSGIEYNILVKECSNDLMIVSTNDSIEINFGNLWEAGTQFHKSYKDSGQYSVLLRSKNGLCSDTTKEIIYFQYSLSENLKVENVFTPNGDGINDCFMPDENSHPCNQKNIEIYNRWGIRIFESDKNGSCWNGRYCNNGDELSSGVYYVLIVNKEQPNETISTIVHLIR